MGRRRPREVAADRVVRAGADLGRADARAPLTLDWVEDTFDGSWRIRPVRGSSTKSYRCPGCAQTIAAATPHLVIWADDRPDGLEARRHWHRSCWDRRQRLPRL